MYLAIVAPHYALYRYFGAAKKKGYQTLALTHDADDCLTQETRFHAWTHTPDVSEIDKLLVGRVLSADAIVESLAPYRDEIAGILPGNEAVVPSTLKAAGALGFRAPRPEDAECQHVKSAMKVRLAERGVSTAPFRIVHTVAEAEDAWHGFGGDSMMKVVDESSSRHVYRVHSLADVRAAWAAMTADKHTEVLLEEYVGGREVSAEGYVSDGRVTILNSCEKSTSDRFVVIGHYVPSHLDADERAAVEDTATDCVRALGIDNSVFHAEIHLKDGVPYVIECAARPPGQFITDVIDWAYDIDLASVNIDLAVGNPVTIPARPPKSYFAQLSFWTPQSGVFTRVEGIDALRERGGLRTWIVEPRPGDRIEALTRFTNRYGAMVLDDDTPEGVRAKATWAADNVWLGVEPDSATPAPTGTDPHHAH